jgi:hypothetical protein
MSALHSRVSFVPRDYSGRVRPLPLRGGQLGRSATRPIRIRRAAHARRISTIGDPLSLMKF